MDYLCPFLLKVKVWLAAEKKRPPEKVGSQGGRGLRQVSGSDWIADVIASLRWVVNLTRDNVMCLADVSLHANIASVRRRRSYDAFPSAGSFTLS